MSNAVFPALPGLAGRLTVGDEFDTINYPSSNGYETRISKFQDPKLHFRLEYYLQDGLNAVQVFEPIRSFYRARRGSFDSFLLQASIVTGKASDSSVTGQALSVQGTYYAPLIHTVSGYDETIYETHTITNVYENGTPTALAAYQVLGPSVSGNYNGFAWPGKIIRFQDAGTGANRAPSTPVTIDFSWYHRVRFAKDKIDYDAVMFQLYELHELELVTARDF